MRMTWMGSGIFSSNRDQIQPGQLHTGGVRPGTGLRRAEAATAAQAGAPRTAAVAVAQPQQARKERRAPKLEALVIGRCCGWSSTQPRSKHASDDETVTCFLSCNMVCKCVPNRLCAPRRQGGLRFHIRLLQIWYYPARSSFVRVERKLVVTKT